MNQCTSSNALKSIANSFKAPIAYAFGYGSGVFSQGSTSAPRQVDLVFAVENATQWHAINLKQNPNHYSFVKHFSSRFLGSLTTDYGAHMYYNPYARINGMDVKYGIVELRHLKADLKHWQTLYIAGRMHKPINVVTNLASIVEAQKDNLMHAATVGLLMLPQQFTKKELFTKIASISYLGDVRMKVAENPQKIHNIVTNQFDQFEEIYDPVLTQLGVSRTRGSEFVQIEPSRQLINSLPLNFRQDLQRNITNGEDTARAVQLAVQKLVKWPSFTQSLKGLVTAGPARSFNYSLQKVKKRLT